MEANTKEVVVLRRFRYLITFSYIVNRYLHRTRTKNKKCLIISANAIRMDFPENFSKNPQNFLEVSAEMAAKLRSNFPKHCFKSFTTSA